MTSLLAPTSLLNKATGSPSSNLNFTQRSLNSNPYRFPYRLSFLLLFCLTPPTFSMSTLLSPSQECHPFSPLPLSHDLVVSAGFGGRPVVEIPAFGSGSLFPKIVLFYPALLSASRLFIDS